MFQTRLRELREAAGYKSQQAFADAFGVPQSTVGGWESGKRYPKRTTLIRLTQFFNVSLDDILGREKPGSTEQKVQPPTDGGERLDRNVIKISGRDGSSYEYEVSDGQRDLMKQVLDNLKPAEGDRT